MPMPRILLIEDNPDLAAGLKTNLELEGHDIRICDDGAQAMAAIREYQPALIVLDIMLPNQDGFQILRRIRHTGLVTPILMLTARGEETDKVSALRQGADDYVSKPFGLMELLARVEAVLRRAPLSAGEAETIEFAGIHIHPATRQVEKKGRAVSLTPKEYDLLLTLAQQPNQVWSRPALLARVWGHAGEVASRTVDTHIAELRRKLEDNPAKPAFLLTARSAGYWLRR